MKKEIWWFDGNTDVIKQLTKADVYRNFRIEIFNNLLKGINIDREGTPDIILIDIGGVHPLFNSRLKHFIRRHSSSLFIVYSEVSFYAKDCAKEMIETFKDEVVIKFVLDYRNQLSELLEKIK